MRSSMHKLPGSTPDELCDTYRYPLCASYPSSAAWGIAGSNPLSKHVVDLRTTQPTGLLASKSSKHNIQICSTAVSLFYVATHNLGFPNVNKVGKTQTVRSLVGAKRTLKRLHIDWYAGCYLEEESKWSSFAFIMGVTVLWGIVPVLGTR